MIIAQITILVNIKLTKMLTLLLGINKKANYNKI